MSTREVVNGADLFTAAARRVVTYLNGHTPLTDWSVTRVAGGEQVHLHVHEQDLLTSGRRAAWEDTYCVRMANGAAHVVPDTLADSDYADHPDAGAVRAYVGFPITDDDGRTFGTLCGVGVEPLDGDDAIDTDLLELVRDLLSNQLAMARIADRARRSAEIASALAHTDSLTGLMNRRGWDLLVRDAEQRVRAYGDRVAVAVIDVDGLKAVNDAAGHGAGDELLRRVGEAITAVARPADRVARYGGDEFAILSNNVSSDSLAAHFGRFSDAVVRAGAEASIGWADTNAGLIGVVEAFEAADARMYAAKQTRRAG